MAHWTDGPEYAPVERPDVFVDPDAPPLGPSTSPSAAGTVTVAGAGPTPPAFTAPDAPPLATLIPDEAPRRDPLSAFDVAATPMTSWSSRPLAPPEGEPVPLAPPEGVPSATTAWGHVHGRQGLPAEHPPAWAPDRPFPLGPPPAPSNVPDPAPTWPPVQINPGGFPQPGPPPWLQPEPPRPFEPVTFGGMLRNATPGVLICLGLGLIVGPFSLALLVIASVLATRIRYRRRVIGRVFSSAIMFSFLFGMAGMIGYQGTFDAVGWYEASTGWAQFACLVLAVAVPLIVGDAMRRGEPPEGRW